MATLQHEKVQGKKKFGTHIPVNKIRSLKNTNIFTTKTVFRATVHLSWSGIPTDIIRVARRILNCKTEPPSPATDTTDNLATDP